jgi:hypothetical protein
MSFGGEEFEPLYMRGTIPTEPAGEQNFLARILLSPIETSTLVLLKAWGPTGPLFYWLFIRFQFAIGG